VGVFNVALPHKLLYNTDTLTYRRFKMYNIDTLVDNTAKQSKAVLAHIPNEEIRLGFETLVDAQATWTKTVAAVATDITKTVAESATSFIPKQTVAKK
jgi:hypothetical protein